MNIYYLLLIFIIIIYFIYTFYKQTEGAKGKRINKSSIGKICSINHSKKILNNINIISDMQDHDITKKESRSAWKVLSGYADYDKVDAFKQMSKKVVKRVFKNNKKDKIKAKKSYKTIFKNLSNIVNKCNVTGRKFKKLFEPACEEII